MGQPRPIVYGGRRLSTGIFKEPVDGPVRVSRLSLDGDRQVDFRFHGGAHKAAYAYPIEHYAFWKECLGRHSFPHGQFGENLTMEGLMEHEAHIGDVLRIGTARFQITQPRVPCFKLGIRMGRPQFPKEFLQSGRVGFYLRVLEEGEIRAGDALKRESLGEGGMTVSRAHELAFTGDPGKEEIEGALAVPALSKEWRRLLRQR